MATRFLRTIWFKTRLSTCIGARTLKTESLHEADPTALAAPQVVIKTSHSAAGDDNAGSMENRDCEWRNILR